MRSRQQYASQPFQSTRGGNSASMSRKRRLLDNACSEDAVRIPEGRTAARLHFETLRQAKDEVRWLLWYNKHDFSRPDYVSRCGTNKTGCRSGSHRKVGARQIEMVCGKVGKRKPLSNFPTSHDYYELHSYEIGFKGQVHCDSWRGFARPVFGDLEKRRCSIGFHLEAAWGKWAVRVRPWGIGQLGLEFGFPARQR